MVVIDGVLTVLDGGNLLSNLSLVIGERAILIGLTTARVFGVDDCIGSLEESEALSFDSTVSVLLRILNSSLDFDSVVFHSLS